MNKPQKCKYCDKVAAVTGEIAGKKISLCLDHAERLRKVIDELKRKS